MAGWRSTRLHVLPQSLGVNLILCTSWFIDENGRHHQLPHRYRRELLSIFLKKIYVSNIHFHLPFAKIHFKIKSWMLNMLQISGRTICKMGHVVLWPPAWLQDINSGDIAELPPEDPPTQAKRDRKGTPSYTLRPSLDVWILNLGCFDFSVAILQKTAFSHWSRAGLL